MAVAVAVDAVADAVDVAVAFSRSVSLERVQIWTRKRVWDQVQRTRASDSLDPPFRSLGFVSVVLPSRGAREERKMERSK